MMRPILVDTRISSRFARLNPAPNRGFREPVAVVRRRIEHFHAARERLLDRRDRRFFVEQRIEIAKRPGPLADHGESQPLAVPSLYASRFHVSSEYPVAPARPKHGRRHVSWAEGERKARPSLRAAAFSRRGADHEIASAAPDHFVATVVQDAAADGADVDVPVALHEAGEVVTHAHDFGGNPAIEGWQAQPVTKVEKVWLLVGDDHRAPGFATRAISRSAASGSLK